MNDQDISPYADALFLLASLHGNSGKYIIPYLLYSGFNSFIVVSFFLPCLYICLGLIVGFVLFCLIVLDLGEFF